jgi:hypothetical protein
LSNLVNAAAISGLGFIFTEYETAFRAMDGELSAYERRRIVET